MDRLIQAIREAKWKQASKLLQANSMELSDGLKQSPSAHSPLHLAAAKGAPLEVIQDLLFLGASLTARNAAGERPH